MSIKPNKLNSPRQASVTGNGYPKYIISDDGYSSIVCRRNCAFIL